MIYISDLDKTLLQDDITLSEYARSTLNRLISEGLLFSVATARSHYSMKEILSGLDLRLPVIGYNGALIADFKSGETIDKKSINLDILQNAVTASKSQGSSLLISTLEGSKNHVYYEEINCEGLDWWFQDRQRVKDPRLKQVRDIEFSLEETAIGLTVIDREEPIKELNAYLNENFSDRIEAHCYENPYHPDWWWISANDKLATKGQALKTVKKIIGLEEEYTIFGDSINDISLFKESDRGIAPSTALPEIAEIADVHLGSNSEDAVVRFIEEEWGDTIV